MKTKNWHIRLNIDDTCMTFTALSHLHILCSYFSYFHHGHGYCAAVISGAFSSQCWRSRQLWSFEAFIQGELWEVDMIGCTEIFKCDEPENLSLLYKHSRLWMNTQLIICWFLLIHSWMWQMHAFINIWYVAKNATHMTLQWCHCYCHRYPQLLVVLGTG